MYKPFSLFSLTSWNTQLHSWPTHFAQSPWVPSLPSSQYGVAKLIMVAKFVTTNIIRAEMAVQLFILVNFATPDKNNPIKE